MQLKKIKISNYRNFRDYSIDFGAETTIFIGKNGTGKTNLISAIAHALSFIFSKKKDEIQYKFIASSDESVKSFESTDARFDYEKQDYSYPLSIQTIAKENIDTVQWEFQKESDTTGLKDSLYSKANKQFWNNHISKGEILELPIFAFFHDSYPHVTASIKGAKIEEKLDSGNPMPRNTAYFKWNDERNCTEIWERYFTMQLTNYKLENKKGNKDYLDAVNQKIINFSRAIFNLTNADEVEIENLKLKNGEKIMY